MTRIIGIDHSMNCPAICEHVGDLWSIDNCSFFFLNTKKKLIANWWGGRIIGSEVPQWRTDTERFLKNAHSMYNWILPDENTQIGIEGYAFGATGSRVFSIGESTGILKTLLIHKQGEMINNGLNIHPFAPGAIKKMATGKGNAKKEDMVAAFQKETGVDFLDIFGLKKVESPIHDIVDSYYVAKFMWNELAALPSA